MANVQKLPFSVIRTDGGTQQRPIDAKVVKKYRVLAQEGTEFPPVNVCKDDNGVYWLYDGFHRLQAYKKLGWEHVQAEVEPGSKREAKFYSFAANKDHGVPRPPGTVKRILKHEIFPDSEWSQFTDELIADWVGVTRQHVSKVREEYRQQQERGQEESQKATTCVSGQGDSPTVSRLENNENPPIDDSESEDNEADEDSKPEVMTDSVGEEVPEHLRKMFIRGQENKARINELNAMKRDIKKSIETKDYLYAHLSLTQLDAAIKNVNRVLKTAIPYAVCRYCMGNGGDCRACNGQGWVDKLRYETTAEELK